MFHVKQALEPFQFQEITGSSGDTVDRLTMFLDLLRKWSSRLNLVSANSLEDPWRRHMLDSAQLVPLLPAGPVVVADLGSGAGFPGVVLAIMSPARVHLIESDSRKCAFLAEVLRVCAASATIHNERIESLPPLGADVVTARGCAPFRILLEYTARHLGRGGYGLFLKGKTAEDELTAVAKTWKMRAITRPSIADPSGFVVRIDKLVRIDGRIAARRTR
jgi:16S rRNA (guanine527-N7)-methyltransferase